jgi:hypothetical protein
MTIINRLADIAGFLLACLMLFPFGLWGYVSDLYLKFKPDYQEQAFGLVYSYKQAEEFGFEPNNLYLRVINDLEPKYLRIIAYWDRIEKEKDNYDFSELDFQIKEAEKRNIKITLIIGEKVPRWPECHYPDWAAQLSRQEQKQEILELIAQTVERYKASEALEFWQLENEPFFNYGHCPAYDRVFFKKELASIKSISNLPVMLTSSGELDTWLRSFFYGDKVGISLYRRFFLSLPFFRASFDFPLSPSFYSNKAKFFNFFFSKEVIITELQSEPWLDKPIVTASLDEQFKELDFKKFVSYSEYAQKTRIKRVYFWGVEWWYWLEENSHPEFRNYVKENIFIN